MCHDSQTTRSPGTAPLGTGRRGRCGAERRIESTIRELPFPERREVVPAITSGITFDPNTGDARVHFYAIPRVLGTNAERPGLAALVSRRSIAGEAVQPCENYTPPRIATWMRAMRRSA